jgi:hypothetical protein
MELPRWVRSALVALAVPQLVVGGWALVDPQSWFDRFPGVDPRLVAAEPPYNQHLATDAGAGFLAVGVALLLAGLLARREAVLVALIAFLVHAVPHLGYHAAHPSDLLTSGEDALNLVLLSAGPLAAAAILFVVLRSNPMARPVGTVEAAPSGAS